MDGDSESEVASPINLWECKNVCEVCGSDDNQHLLMTCFLCRDTQEHYYCGKELRESLPSIWICEMCTSGPILNSTSTSNGNEEDSIGTANSRTNHVDDQIVHDNIITDSCNESSVGSHQPSQTHKRPSEASSPDSIDTSRVKRQKQSDYSFSDSDSAK